MLSLLLGLSLITYSQANVCSPEYVPSPWDRSTSIESTWTSLIPIFTDEFAALDSVLETGKLFMSRYRHSLEFEMSDAEEIADALERRATIETLSAEMRSEILLVAAGVRGRMGVKAGMQGGASYGQLALAHMKQALKLTPRYQRAAQSLGETILNFCKQNWVKRKAIELGLKISIKHEAAIALNHLKENGLTNTELEDCD